MKKIVVCYWHLRELPGLKYKHQQEFEYSTRKRNHIVDDIISKGYSVMLRPTLETETLIIWIDKYRFGQR